ncbi:M48 family metallopeptidase [Chondromyces apiculatus]|uniref:Putative metal-dependent hydrolase n=1 Tax=Chondromyces apiculatus DSM 436 TaxID=1192034 RepID=A0A017T0B2_9BACT|nr:SprT family zinc-dependent metalloprotease [Chondromyces apiculatus]EYF02679.1 Putative metal-dependent hydrolase [Chondromyces apiculatus DSM 436]
MRGEEASAVTFGGSVIRYAIRRSGRRRTVAVAVDARGEVVLSAPADTAVSRLDGVVRAKGAWILEKVRGRRGTARALPAREMRSGETFLYLGRQVRLRVEAVGATEEARGKALGAGKARTALRAGHLVVEVDEALEGAARAEGVRKALVRWYRARARARLKERVARWAAAMGVEAPEVLIREQRKRWGSCDARGVVRLNWRVIQAPLPLVDYVVVHELVHLTHPEHTREFWAALGRVMPDYEMRREELKRLGAVLVW